MDPTVTRHAMHVWHAPFEAIRRGEKTIEMRLYDEKRAQIRQGDEIKFTDADNGAQMICKVIALHRYATFAELYAAHDKISIGYQANEIADPKDMLAYYSQDEIERYDVVGIEISVIE